MTTKTIPFFIPEKFEYLTKQKTIKYGEVNLKTSYLISIIHEIIMKYYFTSKKFFETEEEYKDVRFNLWSIILRDKYGMNYSKYINYLIENDFMTMVSNYYVNKKSKTYKLNYFDLNSIKRIKITDNILLKKRSKEYLEKSITSNNDGPIDLSIKKKLVEDLYHVNVDYDKGIRYINDLKEKGQIDSNKYYKNYTSLDSIKNNHLFFKFDEYGRLHTNFTILKKEIRQSFIKIDNQEIIEIDIKNSQPFFLALLLRDELNIEDDEVKNYVWLVKEGLFYDYIMDKFKNLTRGEVKLLTYKVLFGHNGINSTENKIFKSVFPKIYDYIIDYKHVNNDYRFLAHTLQKMESDFIFGKVIKDIYESIEGIRLFTVHDSILFPRKYEKEVNKIFTKHLKELI
jgi:hypothetical protein